MRRLRRPVSPGQGVFLALTGRSTRRVDPRRACTHRSRTEADLRVHAVACRDVTWRRRLCATPVRPAARRKKTCRNAKQKPASPQKNKHYAWSTLFSRRRGTADGSVGRCDSAAARVSPERPWSIAGMTAHPQQRRYCSAGGNGVRDRGRRPKRWPFDSAALSIRARAAGARAHAPGRHGCVARRLFRFGGRRASQRSGEAAHPRFRHIRGWTARHGCRVELRTHRRRDARDGSSTGCSSRFRSPRMARDESRIGVFHSRCPREDGLARVKAIAEGTA